MRRIILLMLLLAGGTAMAQVAVPDSVAATDTTAGEENVVGGRPQRNKHTSHKANVLSAPVYYDTNGNVVGSAHPSEVYHRPRRHYLNSRDDRYASCFFEGELMLGAKDVAGGFNLTLLPHRWGGYCSLMAGMRDSYFTVGPALRLSGDRSSFDWQLYGGLVLGGKHTGGECGLRMALPKRSSEFCFTSASMGVAAINGNVYMTLGLSLELVACAWLWAVFF